MIDKVLEDVLLGCLIEDISHYENNDTTFDFRQVLLANNDVSYNSRLTVVGLESRVKRLHGPVDAETAQQAKDILVSFVFLKWIDLDQLWLVISHLRENCKNYCIIAVPASPFFKIDYSNILLPLSLWIKILSMAGFSVKYIDRFSCLSEVFIEKTSASFIGEDSWVFSDPLGNNGRRDPHIIMLEPASSPDIDFKEKCAALLDVRFLSNKRLAFGNAKNFRYALNIHHPQDFVNLKPLFEAFSQNSSKVFIRKNCFADGQRILIEDYFKARDTDVHSFDRLEDIAGDDPVFDFLFSSAESNAALSFILSSQIVNWASSKGVPSFLVQHGILLNAIPGRTISYSSDYFLAWGSDYERLMREKYQQGNFNHPVGYSPNTSYLSFGAPKFSDSLSYRDDARLLGRVGIDKSKFRKTVLLATNMDWPAHGMSRLSLMECFGKIIEKYPDVLFILKTHPSESSFYYADIQADNLYVLDDTLAILMDFHVSRLIAGVDLVISTLSSILLDAAVAGVPIIQFETHNKNRYEHIVPVDLEGCMELIDAALDGNLSENVQFRDYYSDGENGTFYAKLSHFLSSKKFSTNRFKAFSDLTLSSEVEQLWLALRARS